MTTITHTIYIDELRGSEFTQEQINLYAQRTEEMISRHYPNADVRTEMLEKSFGIGDGIAGDYAEIDYEYLNALRQDIFNRL